MVRNFLGEYELTESKFVPKCGVLVRVGVGDECSQIQGTTVGASRRSRSIKVQIYIYR